MNEDVSPIKNGDFQAAMLVFGMALHICFSHPRDDRAYVSKRLTQPRVLHQPRRSDTPRISSGGPTHGKNSWQRCGFKKTGHVVSDGKVVE